MKQFFKIVRIFSELLTHYLRHFGLLFMFLVVDGVVAAMSVLAFVPMADFLLDPSLSKTSRVTQVALGIFSGINIAPSFWLFGFLFISLQLLKGTLEVAIRYAILSIKYSVLRGLVSDALYTFFKARWEFFSGADQGRLLNTMNKEANNTRHPLRRSPNNTVVDTAPKTETGVMLAYAVVEWKSGEFGLAKILLRL